jgi:hypothetical protein
MLTIAPFRVVEVFPDPTGGVKIFALAGQIVHNLLNRIPPGSQDHGSQSLVQVLSAFLVIEAWFPSMIFPHQNIMEAHILSIHHSPPSFGAARPKCCLMAWRA